MEFTHILLGVFRFGSKRGRDAAWIGEDGDKEREQAHEGKPAKDQSVEEAGAGAEAQPVVDEDEHRSVVHESDQRDHQEHGRQHEPPLFSPHLSDRSRR